MAILLITDSLKRGVLTLKNLPVATPLCTVVGEKLFRHFKTFWLFLFATEKLAFAVSEALNHSLDKHVDNYRTSHTGYYLIFVQIILFGPAYILSP